MVQHMPKHLSDLIHNDFIHAGDIIFFTFKKNTFYGTITEHGFIHRTKHKQESIFGTNCFDTLTRWTETCLQERLQEYNTRYSAWRRVKHHRTGMSLENIHNKMVQKQLISQRHIEGARLQQLVRLQQMETCELKTQLQDAHQALDKWHDWWRNHSGNTPPPVMLVSPPAQSPKEDVEEEDVEVVEAPDTPQTAVWFPPGKLDATAVKNMDPRAVAAYVHAFFT